MIGQINIDKLIISYLITLSNIFVLKIIIKGGNCKGYAFVWCGQIQACLDLQCLLLLGLGGRARLKIIRNDKTKLFFPQLNAHNLSYEMKYAFVQSESKILWPSIAVERTVNILSFIHGKAINEKNFWRCYFYLGMVKHVQPSPDLTRSTTGVSGWYEAYRQN